MTEAEEAQFLLGSIAPDAIHYRKAFLDAEMKHIGAAKKITHLCPTSDEPWGQVTDNDGWIKCVKDFLKTNPNHPFAAGYTAHVLTDIQNNRTLWDNFRTNHPTEAAKGYTSGYYDDLRHLDMLMYKSLSESQKIIPLLTKAIPEEMPNLVTKEEVSAIQSNIIHEHFKNTAYIDKDYQYNFITLDDMLNFIKEATNFCTEMLTQKPIQF